VYMVMAMYSASVPSAVVAMYKVGCVVQWYNVGLRPALFRCPALSLQPMGDHMWVNHPLQASQQGQLSLSSCRGR